MRIASIIRAIRFELCTLNRQLTDIDVGIKNTTNAIHATLNNYSRNFGDLSPKVKSDFVKRKQEPKEHHRKD
jgi:hypothetical protein